MAAMGRGRAGARARVAVWGEGVGRGGPRMKIRLAYKVRTDACSAGD